MDSCLARNPAAPATVTASLRSVGVEVGEVARWLAPTSRLGEDRGKGAGRLEVRHQALQCPTGPGRPDESASGGEQVTGRPTWVETSTR